VQTAVDHYVPVYVCMCLAEEVQAYVNSGKCPPEAAAAAHATAAAAAATAATTPGTAARPAANSSDSSGTEETQLDAQLQQQQQPAGLNKRGGTRRRAAVAAVAAWADAVGNTAEQDGMEEDEEQGTASNSPGSKAGTSKSTGRSAASSSPASAGPASAGVLRKTAAARAKRVAKPTAASASAADAADASKVTFSPFSGAVPAPWPAAAGLAASAQALNQAQQQELLQEQWQYQQQLLDSEQQRQQELLLLQHQQQQQMLRMMKTQRPQLMQLPNRNLMSLSNSGNLPALSTGGANPSLPRAISVDAAAAAAAAGGALGTAQTLAIKPLTVLEGQQAGGGPVATAGSLSSLGGSLYRSLTAPSMSGYIADLLPQPDYMQLMNHPEGGSGRDFFFLPDDADMAELLLQDATGTPPAATAAAAAAGGFQSAASPRVAAGAAGMTSALQQQVQGQHVAGRVRASASSDGSGSRSNSGDVLLIPVQTGTPTSASAAYARLASTSSPQHRRGQGSSGLTEEQLLFSTWRDIEAQGSMGLNTLAHSGSLGPLRHNMLLPSGSNAHGWLLQYPQQHDQLLLIRPAGSAGLGRAGEAVLLPAQSLLSNHQRLLGASGLMPGGGNSPVAAGAGGAAGLAAPPGLSGSQLLVSAAALRRASSNAQGAAGGGSPPEGAQLPQVAALRLAPPTLIDAAAVTPQGAAGAAVSMRTISSVTNDLTAAAHDAPAAEVLPAAPPLSHVAPKVEAAGHLNNVNTSINNNTAVTDAPAAIAAGVGASATFSPADRQDSVGRVTRAKARTAAAAGGAPDSRQNSLDRTDSDAAAHPKKRARLDAAPPAMVAAEAAARAAGSLPTGPAQGV